jgi:hypothetical protein
MQNTHKHWGLPTLAPPSHAALNNCLLLYRRPFALPSPLTVFGQQKTQFWVTTNAIVTFDYDDDGYTPSGNLAMPYKL